MNAPPGPEPDRDDPIRPGEVVDNCVIEARLGAGSFGAVYRAHHVALDHPRAFKFLLPGTAVTAADKRRFLAEARHTARLGHPNIVVVHNVGEFRSLPFIHMEFLSGTSLRATLAAGRLAHETALRVLDQVLAALAAAHEQGVIHRDVKPDNVMVSGGIVKVVDFGLSVNVQAQTSRLTVAANAVMGTPLYMAPEQWETSWVGPPADVWSAGVMLYELLAGRRPFRGANLMHLKEAIQNSPHVPLHQEAPNLSNALSAVVDRMMDKDPRRRFPDAGQAQTALRAAIEPRPAAAPSNLGTLIPWQHASRPSASISPPEPSPGLSATPPPSSLIALAGMDGPRRFQRPRDGATLILLPGGAFPMGSEGGDPDERPRHRIRLSSFLLDDTPVTRRQFAGFLSLWGSLKDDSGRPMLDPEMAGLERVGMWWEPVEEPDGPVVGVTWYGAAAYAHWAGMRLPTEAQVEFAFRCIADPADPAGACLRRLVGEVRLWCADTYDEAFYRRSPELDPANRSAGPFVAVRGHSRLLPTPAGPSKRQFAAPHEVAPDLGFCCACLLSP
jgi:serine/threonine-protein kinase